MYVNCTMIKCTMIKALALRRSCCVTNFNSHGRDSAPHARLAWLVGELIEMSIAALDQRLGGLVDGLGIDAAGDDLWRNAPARHC